MKTLKELEKRLRDEPDNLGLRVTVAGALREAGRTREAVELYRSVAIAYREQGRVLQAIAVCRSILAIAPDDQRCVELHRELLERPTPDPFPPIALGHKRVPIPTDPGPPRRPEVLIPRISSSDRLDETPLPKAMPYHVADPTSSISKVTKEELASARGSQAQMSSELDVTAELDTRQVRRVSTRELEKLAPPTQPVRRVEPPIDSVSEPPRLHPPPRQRDTEDDLGTDESPELTTPIERIELDAPPLDAPPQRPPTHEVHDTEDGEPEPLPPVRTSSKPGITTKVPVVRDSSPTTETDTEEEKTQPRDTPFDPASLRPRSVDPLATTFFSHLPVERRPAALSRFHRRVVKPGAIVIPRAAANHPFVIVLRGELEVRRDVGRPYRVGPGEYAGETSLLARGPSMATVVAVLETQIIVLLPADFYDIVGGFPALWAELKDVSARR